MSDPLEVQFPLAGVNVATEFELQPDLTTPVGVNVRAYEPLTQRGRGGSRPGLVKYNVQLPNGPHLIQHLNIVVDPTVDALVTTWNTDDLPAGGVDDPSSNNGPIPRQPTPPRKIRVGGNGAQPNRHVGKNQQLSPPPPPPPPPPATGDIVSLDYTYGTTWHNDFNGSVFGYQSHCECSDFPPTFLTVMSDLGGFSEPASMEQLEDTAYINGRIVALTGWDGSSDAVTGVVRTVTGSCDCD